MAPPGCYLGYSSTSIDLSSIPTPAKSMHKCHSYEDADVRRDGLRRLRVVEEFKGIYGPHCYMTKWNESGVRSGVHQCPKNCYLQFVSQLPPDNEETFLPAKLPSMSFHNLPEVDNDPCSGSLSCYLRRNLPGSTYDALGQLYTYSVLGGGTGGAVLLVVTDWSFRQVHAVRHWAWKQDAGLTSRLEVSGAKKQHFFLSVYK